MGNRPHPHRREDEAAMAQEGYDLDTEHIAAAGREEEHLRALGVQRRYRGLTEEELDSAHRAGVELERREREARLAEYENSPEQRDWDSDEEEDQ